MLYYGTGSPTHSLTKEDLENGLYEALGMIGAKNRVLAIPPDFTRYHSQAGILTEFTWKYYRDRLTDVLPAIGTHYPVSAKEIDVMFGKVPKDLFRVHDWRKGSATLGEVPSAFVKKVSEGKVGYGIPVQVDKLLVEGNHDLILSIGQVVPHEVIGMAGYNKNVFIGCGGSEAINKTHFLGAAYGMERMMGRTSTPVREVLNYGADLFAHHLPIVYVLTVVGTEPGGRLVVRGLFVGDDVECFTLAAGLSVEVNIELLDKPLKRVVVYLDPSEFKSTWLGNKSIYRTRMAIADGGDLIVLAPGVSRFGEDEGIDTLIRKYGYAGTSAVLDLVKKHEDLKASLGAAAHLIHGSSDGRFSITYCPGHLTKEEVENVHFRYADLDSMLTRYDLQRLKDGFNTLPDGEELFYISNPALGLWSHKSQFTQSKS